MSGLGVKTYSGSKLATRAEKFGLENSGVVWRARARILDLVLRVHTVFLPVTLGTLTTWWLKRDPRTVLK